MPVLLVSLLLTISDVPTTAPDIVVVCPDDFRGAMQPWLQHRTQQGHVVQFVSNLGSADEIRQRIRTVAKSGKLRFVLLVGDAPPLNAAHNSATATLQTATFSVESKVDRYWGVHTSLPATIRMPTSTTMVCPNWPLGELPPICARNLARF